MELLTNISRTDLVAIPEARTIICTNETTPAEYLNKSISPNDTMLADCFNKTGASYALVDIPVSGQTYILFALTCFVAVLGLFGNSLILTIMIKFRNTPLRGHDVLIIALAVCDGIALIPAALSQTCVFDVIGRDIRAISTAGCKIIMVIWACAMISSGTVVILICIERFVAVWFPFRSKYLTSRTFVFRCLLLCVTIFVSMYGTTNVLYAEITDGICSPNFAGKIYSSVLKRIPDTTVYNGIRGLHIISFLVILCTLTPMTIVKLVKRRNLTTTERDMGNFRISMKLTAVVLAFMCLIALPSAIFAVSGLSGTHLIGTNETRDLLAWLTPALLLNHSTNFILYNIFDAEFRRKALGILFKKILAGRDIKTTDPEQND